MPRTSDHPRTLFSLVLARIRVTSSACLGRYFYDSKTAELYLYYNGTGTPPPEVVVPTLSDMIVVKGTKEAPAHNITIGPGIQFRDNRPTYMEPRTNPSGGDWALERQGAVLLEGCVGCVIEGNSFHQ